MITVTESKHVQWPPGPAHIFSVPQSHHVIWGACMGADYLCAQLSAELMTSDAYKIVAVVYVVGCQHSRCLGNRGHADMTAQHTR